MLVDVSVEVIAYIPEPVPSSSLASSLVPSILLPLICQKIIICEYKPILVTAYSFAVVKLTLSHISIFH